MADDRLNESVMSGVKRNLNARGVDTNLHLNIAKNESVFDEYVNSPALRKLPTHSPDLGKSDRRSKRGASIVTVSQMSKFNGQSPSPEIRKNSSQPRNKEKSRSKSQIMKTAV